MGFPQKELILLRIYIYVSSECFGVARSCFVNKKCERFNSCCWSSLLWDRLYFVFYLSGCILSHYLEIESHLIFPPLASWKSKGKEGERRRTFAEHPLHPWCLAHPILPLPMPVSWEQPGGGSPFCRNWLGEADTLSWVTELACGRARGWSRAWPRCCPPHHRGPDIFAFLLLSFWKPGSIIW